MATGAMPTTTPILNCAVDRALGLFCAFIKSYLRPLLISRLCRPNRSCLCSLPSSTSGCNLGRLHEFANVAVADVSKAKSSAKNMNIRLQEFVSSHKLLMLGPDALHSFDNLEKTRLEGSSVPAMISIHEPEDNYHNSLL